MRNVCISEPCFAPINTNPSSPLADLAYLFALELTLQRIYTTTVQVEILPGNEGRVRNPSTNFYLRLEDFQAGHGLVTLEWELDDDEGEMTIEFKGGGVSLHEDEDGNSGDGGNVATLVNFMFDM